ncbi:alpha-L-fucosidase [Pareuzebyella sediminis]|uniref:alpha-L-fucosidase n=1 Tax=Pareuzebyella sediminis TaxID=2607998 RepID=UPI001E2D25A7|nr:alpha-L-fucosidase [Pareuzebyella sediminis]
MIIKTQRVYLNEFSIKLPGRLLVLPTMMIVLLFGVVDAQSRPDTLFFKDRLQPISEENIFSTEGYYNWGPSIIKGDDNRYHLFYSRWKKAYKFTGWLTHSEIAHAIAKHPEGPYKFKETVVKGRGNGHWDAITAHNPKIKYFDGKYYLYYISTNLGEQDYTENDLIETAHTGYEHPNWAILRPNQRTGVAVAESLNGPWKRMENPLIEPSGPITTLTVNPAIDRGSDGRYYLIVKGDKPNEKRFIRNQAMAVSDSPTGPFTILAEPVIDYLDTEDMSLWYDSTRNYFYGVFHAHSFIGMVSSSDGKNWKKATEFALMSKKLVMKDGTELIPDRLERPFVHVEHDEPRVLAMAMKKGDAASIIFRPIAPKPKYPLPNERQLAWQQAEMGAVFHYDLHVFDREAYGQANNRIDPVKDYQIFNPSALNTDQWVKAAKDAGFTFAILTATHETGFALFQSAVNPYSMKALNFQEGKGDIVRDFVTSCRKYGIKPGIYLGIRWNSFLGVHDFEVNGAGEFKKNRQRWYNHMVEGMVKEICRNYGELFEIWFDGGADSPANGAPDVLSIVQQYQPNCLFYHNKQLAEARWGGSESGKVNDPCWATFPYYSTGAGESAPARIAENNFQLLKEGDPNGTYWMPAMADAPLRGYNGRHEWFWEPGDEDHIFPLTDLMEMYYGSVGRNATLIIGLTPNAEGVLPEPDVNRLKEWGDEIRNRFGRPLAQLENGGLKGSISFDRPTRIDHVVLQEDIRKGERVRKFRVEGLIDDKWKVLTRGENIGHKHIARFDEAKVRRLRYVIEAQTLAPIIKKFEAYFVGHK